MFISNSPSEHLQLSVRNSNGMPEHFPTHHSHVQLLSAFPTHKSSVSLQALGECGGWECQDVHTWHFFVLPSFAADQGNNIPANSPSQPDPAGAGKCLHHLFNPQIVGRENMTRRDGRVDEDREKPSREHGWGGMFLTCLLPTLLLLGTRSEDARAAGRTHDRCSMGLKALPKFFFQRPLASTTSTPSMRPTALHPLDRRSSLVLQMLLMGFLFLIRSLCQN